jgi:hypothetical protein
MPRRTANSAVDRSIAEIEALFAAQEAAEAARTLTTVYAADSSSSHAQANNSNVSTHLTASPPVTARLSASGSVSNPITIDDDEESENEDQSGCEDESNADDEPNSKDESEDEDESNTEEALDEEEDSGSEDETTECKLLIPIHNSPRSKLHPPPLFLFSSFLLFLSLSTSPLLLLFFFFLNTSTLFHKIQFFHASHYSQLCSLYSPPASLNIFI